MDNLIQTVVVESPAVVEACWDKADHLHKVELSLDKDCIHHFQMEVDLAVKINFCANGSSCTA